MRKHLCSLLVLWFCFSLRLFGQAQGIGTYPFASFDTRGFDSVNLGNLNVRFSIPIVNRTGRGIPFNYALQYEGLVWANSGGVWAADPAWGFRGSLNGVGLVGYMTHATLYFNCAKVNSSPPPKYTELKNYVYHDPFGGTHTFDYDYTSSCDGGSGPGGNDSAKGTGGAKDGSGYSIDPTVMNPTQVRTRSGSVITPGQSATGLDTGNVTDSNGNQVNVTSGATFTDTLGVTALTIAGTSPRTFTYPVTRQSNNATTAQVTLSYRNYTVRTNFQCANIVDPGSATIALPDRVTLADNSFFAFTYEGTPSATDGAVTGRLASVTLPRGGTISYSYSAGCGAGINADGTVGSLTRTTSDGTRSYTRSRLSPNATSTTLQDEKGNQTYYTFTTDAASNEFFETHRNVYQGTSGTPLLNVSTCYNGAAANCDTQSLTLPITEADVTRSYNGGSQDITKNSYDTNSGLLTGSTVYSGSTALTSVSNSYNGNGELTNTSNNDGNGTAYTYSYFLYDEGSVTTTSGIPHHIAAPGTRGNLTSTHTSAGSVYLVSKSTYYDTGQPITSTAVDSGATTYGYDATQTFVTQTNLPTPSSGVALSTSAGYDTASAMPLTTTGMNGDQTTINQYDSTMRPVNVNSPNGSVTTYDWYSAANRVVVNQTMGNGQSASSMVLLDGYGRTSRTALLATNTWYMTDYCYDASGLLHFQTLPYAAQQSFNTTKQCSGTGTTYLYDALGRMTSMTNADGPATTQYMGRAVLTTDVNNVQKITQYDLLGRIAGVCEISSNALAGQSPTTCTANGVAMDFAGTGYVTGYSYSLTNRTTTITQGAQQRTFQADQAGRTVLVSEPERGQTTYSYSFNGTGLQVVRARPLQNQANANTLTHVTTQYDTLGRVVIISHDDNLTPERDFYYDVNNPAYGVGGTSTNVKGLLAAGISGSGVTRTTFQYNYDIMGHVTTMWQCAPSICGSQYSRPAIQLGYDLVGNLTSEGDGVTGTIAYGRSPAGEITSMTNQTYSNTSNPPNLVSNTSYGPFGLTAWTLGNSLQQSSFYDGVGRKYAQFICPGNQTNGFNCNSELYGNAQTYKGPRVTSFCDTAIANCQTPGYDEFNRLTGFNGNAWTYDRWGNRLSQTGSPSVTFTFNSANNRNNSFGYDAAGNQTNDALHSYTYDAEGNVIAVDGGSTAQYVYDAANRRVRVQTGSTWTEYLFDPMGQRMSSWIQNGPGGGFGNEGRIWMDGVLVATRDYNGKTYFHHTDPLGTERMRTDYTGAVATTSKSAAFGDGFSQTSTDTTGAAQDNLEFAGLDADAESGTQHAGYRQYSSTAGRWMSPDPYDGSYDATNPQSFNRYAYVLNNPLRLKDSLGLCGDDDDDYEDCDGSAGGAGGASGAGEAGGSGDYDAPAGGGAVPCDRGRTPTLCVTAGTPPAPPAPTPPDPNPPDPSAGTILTITYGTGTGGSGVGGGTIAQAPKNGFTADDKPHWPPPPKTPRQPFQECFNAAMKQSAPPGKNASTVATTVTGLVNVISPNPYTKTVNIANALFNLSRITASALVCSGGDAYFEP